MPLIIGAIDHLAMSVAAPSIQAEFGISFETLRWVFVAYWLPDLVFLVISGRFSDYYGHRRVLLVGFATFAVGAAVGAGATDEVMLFVGRAIQGCGAGIIFGPTLAVITSAFAEDELGGAFGIWQAVGGVGVALSPIVGGLLTDATSWRAMLVIDVALAIGAIVVVATQIRDPDLGAERAPRFDVPGLVTLAVGLALLIVGVMQGPEWGWGSPSTLALFIGALVALSAFVITQRAGTAALLPARVLRSQGFAAGTALSFIDYAITHFVIAIVLIYFQAVLGYSALTAGLGFLAFGGVWFVLVPISGYAADRVGVRPLAAVGVVVMGGALLVLSFMTASSEYWLPGAGLALLALGAALVMPPANKAAMVAVAPEDTGDASGINMAVRLFGALAGLIGGVALFSFRDRAAVQDALEEFGVTTSVGSTDLLVVEPELTAPEAAEVAADAFASAQGDVFLMFAGVALIGLLIALFGLRGGDRAN